MMLTLQVNLDDHPGGRRAYALDLESPLPLPELGDHVFLGPGLGQLPVVRRVFRPSAERVALIFKPPTMVLDWARALEEAEWPPVTGSAPPSGPTPDSPTSDAVTPEAGRIVV